MKIEHVALWTHDLEKSRAFYQTYFDAVANEKYHNPKHDFSSYFLTFAGEARLELMQMPGILKGPDGQAIGWVHIAISVGSRDAVDALVVRLREDGYPVIDGPRTTGDGYYEAVVLDPDGNRVEITI